MAKTKPTKKKAEPTRKKVGRKRPKTGKAKLMRELSEFKNKLRSWVNNTKVVWPDGKPWEDGSRYYFVVDQRLVDFVYKMMQGGRTVKDPDAMEEALKERIAAVNMAIEEQGGITDEEFREKMGDLLTEGDDPDNNGYDAEASEEETEEDQEGEADCGCGAPECPVCGSLEQEKDAQEEAEEGKVSDRRSAK